MIWVYLGGSDLADARFLCNGSDLVDKSQRIREILPTRLKNRAFRRWDELSKCRHVRSGFSETVFKNIMCDSFFKKYNAPSWVQESMIISSGFLLGELPPCPSWSFRFPEEAKSVQWQGRPVAMANHNLVSKWMHEHNNREATGQCFPIIREQRARPGQARPGSLHHHSPTWDGGQGQSETPSFRVASQKSTQTKKNHRICPQVCKHTPNNNTPGSQGWLRDHVTQANIAIATSMYLGSVWFLRDDASPTNLSTVS